MGWQTVGHPLRCCHVAPGLMSLTTSALIDYTGMNIKTAVINIFILTKVQMVTCNMKGVTYCDTPKNYYHPALQFPADRWSILAFF